MLKKFLAMVFILIWAMPVSAFVGVHSDKLEVDGKVIGKPIGVTEMNNLRGGYMGFYFSVLFEGFWDTLGNYNANLTTGGNTPPGDTTVPNLPPNTAVQIQASVGELGDARGMFLISQVPGSGNIVQNTLLVNIQIIQVLGNTIPNLPSLPIW
jgi:hypothetical protein